ncbi:MAG: Gfo/Idh/MocA family oxidoreductase [Chitinophagaceae bacterium]|nr:Gfo/Idh/MocA family oxidoreductase [Chitinophagaceae bacterium]
MKTTRWGIIGPGSIARTFANDLSLLSVKQEIVCLLGRSHDSTTSFAKEFNIKHYSMDPARWLDEVQPDVVYIATPHPDHFEQALDCLQRKIPVLCEKPMTVNADQCRQLINASIANQTFLMEGMWIRFLPSIQLMLEMVGKNMIGKILSVKAATTFKAPPDKNSRYFDPEQGGGSLLDLGIYPVYLTLLLLGRPRSVKAIAKLSDQHVDEACSIMLQYRDGAYAMLESSLIANSDAPAEITGEKGTIKIYHPWFEKATGIELNIEGEGKIIYPCSWHGHGMQYETEEVVRCLQEKRLESEDHPHAMSLDLITLLDEIRRQIKVVYPQADTVEL